MFDRRNKAELANVRTEMHAHGDRSKAEFAPDRLVGSVAERREERTRLYAGAGQTTLGIGGPMPRRFLGFDYGTPFDLLKIAAAIVIGLSLIYLGFAVAASLGVGIVTGLVSAVVTYATAWAHAPILMGIGHGAAAFFGWQIYREHKAKQKK